MKYFTLLFVLLAFASCDTEKSYKCDCSSNMGRILYEYEVEHKQASDGVPSCEAAEDSIAAIYPNAQVQSYFYNVGN